MTTFGFELEVSSGARAALAQLGRDGLTGHTRFHGYHCGCNDCSPVLIDADERGQVFKAQQDCTADGEFITHILEYGSASADRAFNGLSRALLLSGANVSGSVGNHVHVDQSGMDNAAKLRLGRLFVRYQNELLDIAAGPHREIRGYNSRCESRPELWTSFDEMPLAGNNTYDYRRSMYDLMQGSYLSWKDPTVEFRLWNATKAAWRLRTHVGLSVGMVHAAIDGADCTQHDTRCVEEVIGQYLDAPTWGGILRQKYSKGGFAMEVAA